AVDSQRHCVAQLLDGIRRPEGEHHRLAADGLDDPHRLLDSALLVRADREAKVTRFERFPVGCEYHLAAGERHPFDADQDLHALTRRFSGSNSGVDPTTATATG